MSGSSRLYMATGAKMAELAQMDKKKKNRLLLIDELSKSFSCSCLVLIIYWLDWMYEFE